eukprot:gene16510-biopygen13590
MWRSAEQGRMPLMLSHVAKLGHSAQGPASSGPRAEPRILLVAQGAGGRAVRRSPRADPQAAAARAPPRLPSPTSYLPAPPRLLNLLTS